MAALFECRVQFLDDTDPFNSTNFPEPARAPRYAFRRDSPLGDQLTAVHALLRPPHKMVSFYCMRKSGVAEKYVRVVQDMYREGAGTVVRCAVGQTEEFKVEVGLHQGSALSPFLFAIVMDQLSEEVRQESPWTMMFADDIVVCSESREQVEEKPGEVEVCAGEKRNESDDDMMQADDDDDDDDHAGGVEGDDDDKMKEGKETQYYPEDSAECPCSRLHWLHVSSFRASVLTVSSESCSRLTGEEPDVVSSTSSFHVFLLTIAFRLVVKTALKLLLVFVEYSDSNAMLLIQAISAVDAKRGQKQWSNAMEILNEKDGVDTELLVYTMSLINKDLFYDLVDVLEEQGIEHMTSRYSTHRSTDPELREQIRIYETSDFILLIPSLAPSSVKVSENVPEAAMMPKP
ncbi:hypothetical protein QTP70_010315 [Hemibagrus guttatus]|uniref:Reverse transcriptase domain-containing protein n=1 Tax=Hemibagrus guttatus TaxID=175788 RepID=A0AAE0QMF2_9TELE|nr:hypothetical protein QTP70_010315 [Hemibagrus guttatus]